jgi:hypothetical protein
MKPHTNSSGVATTLDAGPRRHQPGGEARVSLCGEGLPRGRGTLQFG